MTVPQLFGSVVNHASLGDNVTTKEKARITVK